jgi:nanoRNase/pAp phosphatase (c-di-AMP/oligoRNAs hydrolase)
LAAETSQLIANLDIMPDEDIANNLMLGLVSETNHFQIAAAADFETAAALLRAGAKLFTPESTVTTGQLSLENENSEKLPETIKVKTDWLKQPKIFSSGESN